MALSKAQLKEILSKAGVSEDNMSAAVKEIMAGHEASIEALQEERDKYKESASKYEEAKKKADDLEKEVEGLKDPSKDTFKIKYEALKEDFANYKKGIEAEKTKSIKADAYKALLKEINLPENLIKKILEYSNMDGIKLDKENKIEEKDKLIESLKEEWKDFLPKKAEEGAKTPTPPAGNGDNGSGEHYAAKRVAEQRAAMYGQIKTTKEE